MASRLKPAGDAAAQAPTPRLREFSANSSTASNRPASPSRAVSVAPPAAAAASMASENTSASAASASRRPKLSSPVCVCSPPSARAGAEDRAEIGIFGDCAGLVGGEIGAADGDRVFGPQTQLLARGVGGEEQAAADFLARHVEKDRGGVQDRRLGALEAGGKEAIERAFAGARGAWSQRRRFAAAGSGIGKHRGGKGWGHRMALMGLWPPFNKAAAGAQPLTSSQGERSRRARPRLPPRPGHGRMKREAPPNHLGAVQPAMKPASALRLLRWVVLAFVLVGLGRAGAQETHRLDLDQTRAALTAAETSLRDGSLDDADLQRLRAAERRARPRASGGDRRH